MKANSCFGCVDLKTEPDAAGGGIYRCKAMQDVIKGEWGHWTSEADRPKPFSDCYKGDCYKGAER